MYRINCTHYDIMEQTFYNDEHEFCYISGEAVEIDSYDKCTDCKLKKENKK